MLRLFRYNGEQVRTLDGELTTETAKSLVWRYLGDPNHRTPLTVEPGVLPQYMIVRTPAGFFTVEGY